MNHRHENSLRIAAFIALLMSASGVSAQSSGKQSGTSDQSGSTQSGASGQSGGMQSGAAGSAGKDMNTVPTHVFMLVPIEVAKKETSTKTGCWAKVYSGENYSGDSLTLAGPVSLADMTGPFGLNWDDRVNSLEMGPKATLTVYDNENYRDVVSEFKPGQRVADISKRLGFFDEFASVRLNCAGKK